MQQAHAAAAVAFRQDPVKRDRFPQQPLAFGIQLRQPLDRHIQVRQPVPCGAIGGAGLRQRKDFLEFPHTVERPAAVDSVRRDFGNRGVILRHPVELHLQPTDVVAHRADRQRTPERRHRRRHRRIADDIQFRTVVFGQNPVRRFALIGQPDTAPLRQPVAGDGGSAAILCKQRLVCARPPQVIVEQFVGNLRDVVKNFAVRHKRLVVRRRGRDIKVVPLAAVPFGIYPVERERHLRVNIGAQRAFRPGGVNFAGRHVADVLRERDGDVFGIAGRRAEVHGDGFGNGYGHRSPSLRTLRRNQRDRNGSGGSAEHPDVRLHRRDVAVREHPEVVHRVGRGTAGRFRL